MITNWKDWKKSKILLKKEKSCKKIFFEEYNVCQIWYGGKADRRNEGIEVGLSLFIYFFSVSNIF